MNNPLHYSLTTRFKDRHIVRLLRPAPGDRVLDLGCGIGYLVGRVGASGCRVYGVDMSREAAGAAGRLLGRRVFGCASATALPFADDVFDKVVFADVIEHLPDDRAGLRELHRVCRHGAEVVIATPALDATFAHSRMKALLHGEDDHLLRNVCEGYTEEGMRQLMSTAGLEPVEVVYTNYHLAEMLLGLTKLLYYVKRRRYRTQAELLALADSRLFGLYRHLVFPVFLALGRAEERLLRGRCRGHCLIVLGRVVKEGVAA